MTEVWRHLKKYKLSYWCAYTFFFLITFGLVYAAFFLGKYSFVNKVDGLEQQYSSLLYFHRWGRNIWDTFVSTGKWEFPIWDFNIGLGDDIYTTILYYYVWFSPTAIGAVFCPEAWLEYYFALEFLFRLFLAGISFSIFARWHRKTNWGILLGSITYCFCGFVIQKGLQHPYFVIPMIYLPLMLLGVDKILKRQSPLVFILSTAFCAITNFYFFYMIVIAVVLYFFGQVWFSGERSVSSWMKWIGTFLIYGLISVALSGFIFIPTVSAILGSDRVGAANEIPLFYSISHYYQLLWGSGTNELREFDSRTGFALPVLASIFLLWIRKGRTKFKVYFIVLLLFLCIPWFGSVFNGFGYISNRWIFIFSFLVSYIFTEMYPYFLELTETDAWKMLIVTGMYLSVGAVVILFGISENIAFYRNGIYLLGLIILLGYLICQKKNRNSVQIVLVVVTVASIVVNGYLEYFPTQRGAVRDYIKKGDVLREYTGNLPSNDLLGIEDVRQYRSIVSPNINERKNSFIIQQIPGTRFYFSVTVNSVNKLFLEMYYNNPMEHPYNDLQDRLILNSLASVKYFLTKAADQILAEDTAFVEIESENKNRRIFENIYAVPMAYLYETYIPRKYYDEMDVVDKQEAMAQGAVMESSNLPETAFNFSSYEIGYDIYSDNVSIEDNRFVAKAAKAEAILSLEQIPEDAEVYVIVEGMEWKSMDPISLYAEGDLENVSWFDRQIIRNGQFMYTEDDNTSIDFNMSGHEGTINYMTPSHIYYCGRHNFLCNLGYISEGESEITLCFNKSGIYTFDKIRVVVQPREPVEKYLSDLLSAGVKDWNFSTNAMGGHVTCEKASVLCVPVSYSKGWSAYVDGTEVKVEQVNTAFMGVELNAGEHDVKFVYHVPYGNIGIFCSFVGIVAVVSLIVIQIRKRQEEA